MRTQIVFLVVLIFSSSSSFAEGWLNGDRLQVGITWQGSSSLSNKLEGMHQEITGPELSAEITTDDRLEGFVRYFFHEKVGVIAHYYWCGLASSSVAGGQSVRSGQGFTTPASTYGEAEGIGLGLSVRPVNTEKFVVNADFIYSLASISYIGAPLGIPTREASGAFLYTGIAPAYKIGKYGSVALNLGMDFLSVSDVEFRYPSDDNPDASDYNQNTFRYGLTVVMVPMAFFE